jgi:hypothetical protein
MKALTSIAKKQLDRVNEPLKTRLMTAINELDEDGKRP